MSGTEAMIESEDMGERKAALGKLEWGVIVSMTISAATLIFSVGVTWGTISDHERRLEVIELEDREVAKKLAAIDANVQFLVNRARDEDNRK
jgi:hypothetical protein